MNLNVLRVVDERITDSSPQNVSVVLKEGAMTTNYQSLPANGYSNQSINFNLNNIGNQVYRDPRLCIGMQAIDVFQVTNTSATAVDAFITSDNYGNKPWPCNRLWAISHQINGATENLNTYDVIDALCRLNILPEDMNWIDNTLPDFIDNYAAATGSNFNPIQSYSATLPGDGVFKQRSLNFSCQSYYSGTLHANSSFVPGSGTGGGVATIIVTHNYYEPLISPFLNISSKNGRGAVGITGEIINLTVQPDIFNNMRAFVNAYPLVTVNSTNTYIAGTVPLAAPLNFSLQIPTLYPIILTPYKSVQDNIPYEDVYEYNKITVQTSPNIAGSLAAQTQITGVSSVVAQYDHLPELLAWYIRTTNGYRTSATPDKFLQYVNASFTMNQGNPQLNGAIPDQVYDIALRNGLKTPRACWKQAILNYNSNVNGYLYGSSGPVVLSPALDLNAQEGLMTGTVGQFTFQMTNGTFKNATDTAFSNISLYVLAIQKGVLKREGLQYNSKLLDVLPSQIEHSRMLPPVMDSQYRHALRRNGFMGAGIGDFFKDVWKGIKKVGQFAWQNPQKVVEVAQAVKPFVDKARSKGKGNKRELYGMRGGEMLEGVDAFYE